MKESSRLFRSLIMPVYAPNVASTLALGMLGPTLPLYLSQIGVSLRLAGIILAGAGLGALVAGLPMGSLIAKVGEDRASVAGLIWLGASTALLGISSTAIVLLVLRMLFGAAFTVVRLSRQTWVTRRIDPGIRGRVMALFGGSSRVGLLLGPLIGGILAETIGFEWTFVIAGLLTFVGVAPLSFPGRKPVAPLDEFAATSRSAGMMSALRRHRRLLAKAAIIPFLVTGMREGRTVVLPLIGEELELRVSTIGALVALGAAADLVLVPVSGVLMDRLGRLWSMVPAFGLIAFGLGLLGIGALAESVTIVVAAGVVMGLGNGLSAGSMLTLGADLAPADSTSEFLAGVATVQEGGRVIGPMVVGFVAAVSSLAGAALALAGLGSALFSSCCS